MPIFYLLHQTPIWLDLEDGKRNARIFIFGMVGWVLLYGLIYHFKVKSNFLDWLYYGLIVLFIADVCVMGWIYKDYYGRSIMHEFDPDDKDNWKLNPENHQYEKVEHLTPTLNLNQEGKVEMTTVSEVPEFGEVNDDIITPDYQEEPEPEPSGDKVEIELESDKTDQTPITQNS